MLTFTPIERQTLLALWDQEDEWWQYWWIMSDRFEEDGDRDGARFVRWLHQWRKRGQQWISPWLEKSQRSVVGKWFWWTGDSESVRVWMHSGWQYPLPQVFDPICAGYRNRERIASENSHDCRVDNLNAALQHYRTLTDAQKQDLDDNWMAS